MLLLASQFAAARAQSTPPSDPIVVSSEHPRLFLRPARLRLLRRERERASLRWEQFEALMKGNAAMPEAGFAFALYYQVAGDKPSGRKAIAWALTPAAGLRQMALVFDWCYDLMADAERQSFAARLAKKMADAANDPKTANGVSATSARTLAAVALFDEIPDAPARELERTVHHWWEGNIVAAIRNGGNPIARDDAYALYEMLHAIQDNVKLDLRESAAAFFKDFPIEHLLSYYPAPFPAPENDFFIGAERAITPDPDLTLAALSRAAELRGAFGTPYEFLWANPYQPGLSYYHIPLAYYAPERGRLFIRSSWDDAADWFGVFDGIMQMFTEGQVKTVTPSRAPAMLDMREAIVCFGEAGWKQQFSLEEAETVFVVGLEPKRTYQIEVDDEEVFEAAADQTGILELDGVPWGRPAGVRIK